jgi:hypothetical protein
VGAGLEVSVYFDSWVLTSLRVHASGTWLSQKAADPFDSQMRVVVHATLYTCTRPAPSAPYPAPEALNASSQEGGEDQAGERDKQEKT